MVPANGTLYTAQNNCACVGSQVGGFLALANNDGIIATANMILKISIWHAISSIALILFCDSQIDCKAHSR